VRILVSRVNTLATSTISFTIEYNRGV
jgi:hypothetical protein